MTEVKSGVKDFPFFLSQHGSEVMQVDIPEKNDVFSAAWNVSYASRKRIKKREICKINYGGRLPASQYEIRPQAAGNGPLADYAMRPASA